jgi:PAS domain S-box-containing protein
MPPLGRPALLTAALEPRDRATLEAAARPLGMEVIAACDGGAAVAHEVLALVVGVGPDVARALALAAAARAARIAPDVTILLAGPAAQAAHVLARARSLAPVDWLDAPLDGARAGARLRLVATLHDTARREDVARVRAESDRRRRLYETILSNTPDLAYVFDLEHRFTYANEVLLRMWGRTWDEAIGRNCLELGYEPWHAQMHDREIEQVKATRQPIRGEVPFHGTFGRRIYDYIFVPVLGPDGEVEAVAGTTRDVTERKQAEEAMARLLDSLREANQMKDQFLATLAHELRNPLAPLRSGLAALQRDGAADGKVVDMMERQLAHLVHLVDDLLDVSRVTSGKITLRPEALDLREVVESALDTVRPLVEASGHVLEVSLDPAPMPLEGDRTRLSQVLTNILNNATKYTPRGGHIALRAHRDGDEALIEVRDSGVGIPGDMLDRVFEVFTQVGSTLDRAQGGLGLGLALVRRLVEMHGGRVWAESAGAGEGSTFVVRLPLATSQPSPAAMPAARDPAPPVPAATPAMRILVVDDNVDAAQSLALLLGFAGHVTHTAHSGPEALTRAADFGPDVIFLDIGLPGINGYDVARALRAAPATAATRIIALTGWGSDEDRRRAVEAGFDHHLTKPARHADVEAVLARIAARAP